MIHSVIIDLSQKDGVTIFLNLFNPAIETYRLSGKLNILQFINIILKKII